MKVFTDYVLSFYGQGGIYDIEATREEVERATHIRKTDPKYKAVPFDGDTVDREWVRDIIIMNREYKKSMIDIVRARDQISEGLARVQKEIKDIKELLRGE